MAIFTRIFELPNNNQVLLTREYDDEDDAHNVKVRSDINGLQASISLGFDTEEKADKVLKDFTLDQAKNMRNQMMNLLT